MRTFLFFLLALVAAIALSAARRNIDHHDAVVRPSRIKVVSHLGTNLGPDVADPVTFAEPSHATGLDARKSATTIKTATIAADQTPVEISTCTGRDNTCRTKSPPAAVHANNKSAVSAGREPTPVQPNYSGREVIESSPTASMTRDDPESRNQIVEATAASAAVGTSYHNYQQLTERLEGYATDPVFSGFCRLTSIGTSVLGRELWALKITDNPDIEEDEPEVAYKSTMHGNERLGTEMCLFLIDYLLLNYGDLTDDGIRATALVDDTEIWFLPLMNPDGLEAGVRQNAHGHDLNRSFLPDGSIHDIGNAFDGPPWDTATLEPETAAVCEWQIGQSFVLAANFHTGARVVVYPYGNDGVSCAESPKPYSATPDDALYRHLANVYASNNPVIHLSPSPAHATNGIINGAAWYGVCGEMADWSYRYLGVFETTVELELSTPPNSQLPTHWDRNRESMLSYLETAHIGIRGVVTDADTGAPLWAKVTVLDGGNNTYTDPDAGDYHRLLLRGTYDIVVSAAGYDDKQINAVGVTTGASVRVDVQLSPTIVPVDLTIALSEGWNLLSVPFHPVDPRIQEIFHIDNIVGQQPPEINAVYLGSAWVWTGNRLLATAEVGPGTGFWIWITADVTIRVQGISVGESEREVILLSGWNLIGPLTTVGAPYNDLILGTIYWWDTGQYRPVLRSIPSDALEVGRGYWIYSLAEQTYLLSE